MVVSFLVMLAVMLGAEPDHVERFTVVFMVSLNALATADRAGLLDQLAAAQRSQNAKVHAWSFRMLFLMPLGGGVSGRQASRACVVLLVVAAP